MLKSSVGSWVGASEDTTSLVAITVGASVGIIDGSSSVGDTVGTIDPSVGLTEGDSDGIWEGSKRSAVLVGALV